MWVGLIDIRLRERLILDDTPVKRCVEIDLIVDVFAIAIGWRKLQTTVDPELGIVFVVVCQGGAQVDRAYSDLLAVFPPQPSCLAWVWEALWLIHNQERSA